jgi:ankyrin repeat protein
VAVLLDAGANPNLANRDGLTPLMYAAGQGRLELVRLLLAHGADVTAKALDGKHGLAGCDRGGGHPGAAGSAGEAGRGRGTTLARRSGRAARSAASGPGSGPLRPSVSSVRYPS